MSCSSTGCSFNVVMIVPTGIGAAIGGHAGDATPAARLLASSCDLLILHPNVVNASDINEMPANSWYVEGSILDRLLEGKIGLRPVRSNKILVAVNSPLRSETVNAVSAARVTLGADIEIMVLRIPLRLLGGIPVVKTDERVSGWQELVDQVQEHDFDALAIASLIEVKQDIALRYLKDSGVNPWGWVEAMASRLISEALGKPTAHAPIESGVLKGWNEVVDPRMGAELISMCYLHCVLKGLHQAPRLVDASQGFSITDVSCLVSPFCFGRPHRACLKAGVPVIAVRENTTCYDRQMPDGVIMVENYLEAVGGLAAMRVGMAPAAVRRPLAATKIHVGG